MSIKHISDNIWPISIDKASCTQDHPQHTSQDSDGHAIADHHTELTVSGN
jgi:hypothetical protein